METWTGDVFLNSDVLYGYKRSIYGVLAKDFGKGRK